MAVTTLSRLLVPRAVGRLEIDSQVGLAVFVDVCESALLAVVATLRRLLEIRACRLEIDLHT